MNEVQLMECGYRHLEIELFNTAVKMEEDGGFTVALRNEEWICGDGMARGYWVKVDDFRLIREIRAELFVALRDRFAKRDAISCKPWNCSAAKANIWHCQRI